MHYNNQFIWRIETGTGRGAYMGGLCYRDDNETAYSSKYHPGPRADKIDTTKSCLFGFQSIHHARRWFSSLHDLRNWEKVSGARLVVWRRCDCVNIQEGSFQMVFKPKKRDLNIDFPASYLHEKTIDYLLESAEKMFNSSNNKQEQGDE